MSNSIDDLTKRYEALKSRHQAFLQRMAKIDAARDIASSKSKGQEAELKALGIDPERVEEWIKTESEKLEGQLKTCESDTIAAEKILSEIEQDLKNLS